MKSRAAFWIGGVLAGAAATASAQGDFPFGEIPGLTKEPSIQIDLNPEMMKIFGGAANGVDPQAAAALRGITNMRVRVYEDIDDEIQDLVKFVNDTTARLEREGWNSIVRVNDGDEQVRIYMKPGADATISGLTVMVTDAGGDGGRGEFVLINVAGVIHPEQLASIAASIGTNGMFRGRPGIPGLAED
jgi:hypothetical protein